MKKAIVLILVLTMSISLFGCAGSESNAEGASQQQTQESQNQTPNTQEQSPGTNGDESVSDDAKNEASDEAKEEANDEAMVNSVVEEFGKKLQLVSLLGPEEELEKSMQENYSEFVSPALIEQWIEDPLNAPGRLTSSPWPDRIEIISTEKTSEESYEVKVEIIEVANAEEGHEDVAKRPITLIVEKIEGKWLINNVTLGEYEDIV
jgi:hypothetical protein